MLTFAAPAAPHPIPAGNVADVKTRAWAGAYAEEHDFETRRRLCTLSGRHSPLERVAALLISISRNNSYEGRDPTAIPESLSCGFVADLLGLSITALGAVLVELKDRGLVAPAPSSGLRVTDLTGLERLAGPAIVSN